MIKNKIKGDKKMSEEERKIIETLLKKVATLENIVEGQRLDIEKLNRIAITVDLINKCRK